VANRNATGSPRKPVADTSVSQLPRAGNGARRPASAAAFPIAERPVDPGIALLHGLARAGMLREIPKSAGRQWRAWCPICDGDRLNRYLVVTLTGAEPWVECSNGCSAEDVLAALHEAQRVGSQSEANPGAARTESATAIADAPLPRLIADMSLPEAAEHYVTAFGWPVFPLHDTTTGSCSCGQQCGKNAGKHPRTIDGFKNATTDLATVRSWWQWWPWANIGVPTGHPVADVLDIDVRESGNGWAAYATLRDRGLLLGAFALSRTPSRGKHLWFAGTEQRNGSLRRLYVDFRAAGGYVLVPPSVVGGQPYVWEAEPNREVLANASVLDWAACKRILDPPIESNYHGGQFQPDGESADADSIIAWMGRQQEGDLRNNGLFWAANRLVEKGNLDRLEELSEAATSTGLTPTEIKATIKSALRTSGDIA
jgi:Bifunctional DNA primase/polymerase, N-terminal